MEDFIPPNTLNPNTIIYYSAEAKMAKKNVRSKAQKFLQLGLIEYNSDKDEYYCKPIKGYNNTTYTIKLKGAGYECNCQACQTKMRKNEYNPDYDTEIPCSHALAVNMLNKIEDWNAGLIEKHSPHALK